LKIATKIADTGTAQTKACQRGVTCLSKEMTNTAAAKTQTKETVKAVTLILL